MVALFLGGAFIVFTAETIGVAAGLLEHRLEPQLLGVPAVILLGWPGLIYFALRLAQLLVGPGHAAALLAALIATTVDTVLDPIGVRAGAWRYPATPVSRYRHHGVPYWNTVAWFGTSFLAASLPPLTT